MLEDAAETTRDAVSIRTGFAGFMMPCVIVVVAGGAVGSARKVKVASKALEASYAIKKSVLERLGRLFDVTRQICCRGGLWFVVCVLLHLYVLRMRAVLSKFTKVKIAVNGRPPALCMLSSLYANYKMIKPETA